MPVSCARGVDLASAASTFSGVSGSVVEPHARRMEEGVADRGRHRRRTGLAQAVDPALRGILGQPDRPALGQVAQRRDHVVGEGRVHDLAAVELDLLEQRLTDAERDVALALERREHGVDDLARVGLDVEIDHAHDAGLEIDLDLGARGGVEEVRRDHALAGLRVEPPGALVDGALDEVAAAGPAHDLAVGEVHDRARCPARPGPSSAVSASIGADSSGAASASTSRRRASPASSTAPPIISVERLELVRLVPRRRVGVGIGDDDAVDGDSQRVGRDLREHRSGALADLDRAREEACGAVLVQLDRGRRRRGRHRRLERAGEALAAHQAGRARLRGPRPAPADALGDGLQQLVEVEVLDGLAGGELVAVAQQVLEAKLERVDAEALGDQVHLALVGPGDLRDRVAAEAAGRRHVRVDGVGVDRHVRDPVRPRRAVAAVLDQPRADVGVRARAPEDPRLARDDRAVAAHPGPQVHRRRVAGDGEELLGARELDADRPPPTRHDMAATSGSSRG